MMRYDFDHTGLRLDTDYSPYFVVQGRGRRSIILSPYEELRERLRPQDFCFYGFFPSTALRRRLGNQDYHEHTSGASFQTGYFKKATILASYLLGDGVNFVAPPARHLAATPYNHPFLAREDTASPLTFRPMKPLKIENTYLFERLRANEAPIFSSKRNFPASGGASSTITSCAANGTGNSRRNFPSRDPAIQRAAGRNPRRGLAVHLPADPEAIQRRFSDYLSGASRHGDLCRLQQRPAEPERGPAPLRPDMSRNTPRATSTTAASSS